MMGGRGKEGVVRERESWDEKDGGGPLGKVLLRSRTGEGDGGWGVT
jgi:hypothetical protein